jgi:hypothetical protein
VLDELVSSTLITALGKVVRVGLRRIALINGIFTYGLKIGIDVENAARRFGVRGGLRDEVYTGCGDVLLFVSSSQTRLE